MIEQRLLAFDSTDDTHRLSVGKGVKLVRITRQKFGVLIAEHRQRDIENAVISRLVITPTAPTKHVNRAQMKHTHRRRVDTAHGRHAFLHRDREFRRQFAQGFGDQRSFLFRERRQGHKPADDGWIAWHFEWPDTTFIQIDIPGRIERHD